jgi:hypothetical protein
MYGKSSAVSDIRIVVAVKEILISQREILYKNIRGSLADHDKKTHSAFCYRSNYLLPFIINDPETKIKPSMLRKSVF